MNELIFILIYMIGLFIGVGVGSRVFYHVERRSRPHDRAVAIYQDAVLQGAVVGLLWPVALPIMLIFGVGWQAARMAAPKEVRQEVTAHNTAMMERMLGWKDKEFELDFRVED
jgi:hypothetical protein